MRILQTVIGLLFVSQCYGSFTVPKNINFNVGYYNTSNCLKEPYYDNSFVGLCTNTDMRGGYYECCYDILDKLTVNRNISFNVCYTDVFNGTTTYMKYDCDGADINSVSSLEIFAIIGLLCIVAIGLSFMCLLCRYLFCNKDKNGYNRF